MLPENTRDLIEAVEEYTDYYFLDARTFADHFIEKVSLPHSVHFGLLDDSWTDSFEHAQSSHNDQERPKDNECEPDDGGPEEGAQNKRLRRKKTTRAEVTHERKVSASTPIITANDPSVPASNQKRKLNNQNSSKPPSKRAKPSTKTTNSTPIVKTGLKNKKQKTKTTENNTADESMLQEGKSVGFEDNKGADQRERASASSSIPVKIQSKPLELTVGQQARSDGKSKFSARHLPDFIRENDGDRSILYPLAKEALGHVHSWGVINRNAVQSIVDRGWGPGKVVIPEVGKSAISGVVDVKASDLRHEMSTIAVTAVQEFFDEHSTTSPPPEDPDAEEGWIFRDEKSRAEYAQYMTSKYPLATQKGTVPVSPMHFREFQGQLGGNASDPVIISKSGLFEHPLILRVLGVYFSCIELIPEGIERREEKPFGALELAIQSVERALTLFHTGHPPSREELASKKNHFSYANWGAQPVLDWAGKKTEKSRYNEFRSTIRSLGDAKWKAIVAGAREFVVKKRTVRKRGASRKEKPVKDGGDELSNDDGDIIMSDLPDPIPESIETMATTGRADKIESEASIVGDGSEKHAESGGDKRVEVGDYEGGSSEEESHAGSGQRVDDKYGHNSDSDNDFDDCGNGNGGNREDDDGVDADDMATGSVE
ncbi:hypothetical protein AAF712_012955 [Marasmius tenuissimus]|uniref:Uncharacterized protein n=1 Tax=Marasmius tenuissimus TaxID=585030 RepID=A0ABR2ZGA8_9AGAR